MSSALDVQIHLSYTFNFIIINIKTKSIEINNLCKIMIYQWQSAIPLHVIIQKRVIFCEPHSRRIVLHWNLMYNSVALTMTSVHYYAKTYIYAVQFWYHFATLTDRNCCVYTKYQNTWIHACLVYFLTRAYKRLSEAVTSIQSLEKDFTPSNAKKGVDKYKVVFLI